MDEGKEGKDEMGDEWKNVEDEINNINRNVRNVDLLDGNGGNIWGSREVKKIDNNKIREWMEICDIWDEVDWSGNFSWEFIMKIYVKDRWRDRN